MSAPKRKLVQALLPGAKKPIGELLSNGRSWDPRHAAFAHRAFGSICGTSTDLIKVENNLYDLYMKLNGTEHKDFVCCPRCAYKDGGAQEHDYRMSNFTHAELAAYIEANALASRCMHYATRSWVGEERDKLRERIESLENELWLLNHERSMELRDRENKRAREEKSVQASSS